MIRHIDDYYQFFGHKYFLEEVANLFLQKINSNYNYVRFLFIDMFTLLYKLSNNSLESIPEEVFVFNPSYCSLLR